MKYYYCSIIDGKKKALLGGPYSTKEQAEAALPAVIRRANEVNSSQSAFAAFGTAGSDTEFKTAFGLIGVA